MTYTKQQLVDTVCHLYGYSEEDFAGLTKKDIEKNAKELNGFEKPMVGEYLDSVKDKFK